MSEHRFATLDVFTATPFCGNPLAVVWDADDLDDGDMLSIAREFGFSETVFLQSTEREGCDVRTRIFTPAGELPFAGHPTVGTAVAVGRDRGTTSLVFDQLAGPVAVTIDGGSASFTVERPVEIGPAGEVPAADLARMLGIAADEVIADGRHVSVGVGFLMVEVATLDALARCRATDTGDVNELYVVCHAGDGEWRARMFAPNLGIVEDPATGSAATAFAGLLALAEPDGQVSWVIHQGVEMGRPSRIEVTADVSAGRPRWIRVTGDAVVVTEGLLHR
jgi:trans-2,3-dihydro-3-hydroxyanthranilate isomerase